MNPEKPGPSPEEEMREVSVEDKELNTERTPIGELSHEYLNSDAKYHADYKSNREAFGLVTSKAVYSDGYSKLKRYQSLEEKDLIAPGYARLTKESQDIHRARREGLEKEFKRILDSGESLELVQAYEAAKAADAIRDVLQDGEVKRDGYFIKNWIAFDNAWARVWHVARTIFESRREAKGLCTCRNCIPEHLNGLEVRAILEGKENPPLSYGG